MGVKCSHHCLSKLAYLKVYTPRGKHSNLYTHKRFAMAKDSLLDLSCSKIQAKTRLVLVWCFKVEWIPPSLHLCYNFNVKNLVFLSVSVVYSFL